MSRPFFEIMGMIKAHYENDDAKFNAYGRAILDYYNKDGNYEGVKELLEIMTIEREPRTDIPLGINETFISVDNSLEDNEENIIEDSIKDNIQEDNQVKEKRHRRTKKEMEEYRNSLVEEENNDNENKPKRHRRTKAELEAIGYYNK